MVRLGRILELNLASHVALTLGSLFHLDFLALKTNQAKWLLDVWSAYSEMNKSVRSKRLDVGALPGWAYARALAHFIIENSKHDTVSISS